jgi:hypothetical protein
MPIFLAENPDKSKTSARTPSNTDLEVPFHIRHPVNYTFSLIAPIESPIITTVRRSNGHLIAFSYLEIPFKLLKKPSQNHRCQPADVNFKL